MNQENIEKAPTAEETRIYNKAQVELATRFFPDMSPSEAMMTWSSDNGNNLSKDFRDVLNKDPDLRRCLLEGDTGAIDDIETALQNYNN